MNRTFTFVALIVVGWIALPHHAATIDFEYLATPSSSSYTFGNLYIEDGHMFVNASASPLSYYGTQHADFAGSTALFGSGPGQVTLAKVNGRGFTLKSIDLAPLTSGSGPVSVSFAGYTKKGDVINQTFTHDGASQSFNTYDFTGFKNVQYVQWSTGGVGHQFDNLVVHNAPEPSSVAFAMFIGLVAVPMAFGRWTREPEEAG